MILATLFVINVTVLQGCNYAPIGEICAPQYDLPHWYTGSSSSYTYSYSVNLTQHIKPANWSAYAEVMMLYLKNLTFHPYYYEVNYPYDEFKNEPYPEPNFVFRNGTWIKNPAVFGDDK